jgi:uncharacterized membrane protein (UPF0127 family)
MMQILQFPFKQTATLNIANSLQTKHLDCELATTDLEIFQSLNFRTKEEFKKPLVLVFSNPNAQTFSRINFQFPVEQIAVDSDSHVVKEITTIYPAHHKETSMSLKAYSNYGIVILAPKGSSKQHNITLDKTRIAV